MYESVTLHTVLEKVGPGDEDGSADLRGTSPSQALFEDCDFSEATLTGPQFKQCALTRCRFVGDLREVLFDGRELSKSPAPAPMRDVDFAQATFHDVEFRGFDLEEVTLPPGPRRLPRPPLPVRR